MAEFAVDTLRVQRAERADVPPWLALARELEPLFGAMADDPVFQRALLRNVARHTAFCIRADDGPPGSPLWGGLLLSPRPPAYRIGWLAVTAAQRQAGLGRRLVEHALASVPPDAEALVITFGPGVPGGEGARAFYQRMGFAPAEMAAPGANGTARQVFRRPVAPGHRQDPTPGSSGNDPARP